MRHNQGQIRSVHVGAAAATAITARPISTETRPLIQTGQKAVCAVMRCSCLKNIPPLRMTRMLLVSGFLQKLWHSLPIIITGFTSLLFRPQNSIAARMKNASRRANLKRPPLRKQLSQHLNKQLRLLRPKRHLKLSLFRQNVAAAGQQRKKTARKTVNRVLKKLKTAQALPQMRRSPDQLSRCTFVPRLITPPETTRPNTPKSAWP